MVNVVRRPFRSNGIFYAVGSIITDPTAIKLFRQKIAEGKIVLVTEQNLNYTIQIFEVKCGLKGFGDVLKEALNKKEEAESEERTGPVDFKEPPVVPPVPHSTLPPLKPPPSPLRIPTVK